MSRRDDLINEITGRNLTEKVLVFCDAIGGSKGRLRKTEKGNEYLHEDKWQTSKELHRKYGGGLTIVAITHEVFDPGIPV